MRRQHGRSYPGSAPICAAPAARLQRPTRARRLVHEKYRSVAQDRARNCDAPRLTFRQAAPALAGLFILRHLLHEVPCRSRLQRRDEPLVARRRPRIRRLSAHSAGKRCSPAGQYENRHLVSAETGTSPSLPTEPRRAPVRMHKAEEHADKRGPFPRRRGRQAATISPGAASSPSRLLSSSPRYTRNLYSQASARMRRRGLFPAARLLSQLCSSGRRGAATELVMAEGSMPTRPENALLRLARCWRNSVIVPKFIYPPHSRQGSMQRR